MRQAVEEVLPPFEKPLFCFDALVKEYVNSTEQFDFDQELKNIEKESTQASDREVFVRKALSNFRLDQAIKQWGKAVIKKARGESFIEGVRDGHTSFPLSDLERFNRLCETGKSNIQRSNKLDLERVVLIMGKEFSLEIVQAVSDDLDPDITLGKQRVKQEEFRQSCQELQDEQLEAQRLLQEIKEVEQLFKEQMIHELSEVYGTVLQKVNDKNPQKFNLALIKALIGWVSKNIDQLQISEVLASAFAYMGLIVGEGGTSDALKLADQHKKVLAKADPFEAFKLAIFPEDTQIETFEFE